MFTSLCVTHFSSDFIMGVSNCTSVCISVSTLYTSGRVISLTTSSCIHSSISCLLVTSIGTSCNFTVSHLSMPGKSTSPCAYAT